MNSRFPTCCPSEPLTPFGSMSEGERESGEHDQQLSLIRTGNPTLGMLGVDLPAGVLWLASCIIPNETSGAARRPVGPLGAGGSSVEPEEHNAGPPVSWGEEEEEGAER